MITEDTAKRLYAAIVEAEGALTKTIKTASIAGLNVTLEIKVGWSDHYKFPRVVSYDPVIDIEHMSPGDFQEMYGCDEIAA